MVHAEDMELGLGVFGGARLHGIARCLGLRNEIRSQRAATRTTHARGDLFVHDLENSTAGTGDLNHGIFLST